MDTTPDGGGYWLLGCDGSIYEFGNAPNLGAPSTYACRGTVGMTCVDTAPGEACSGRRSCLMAPNDSWAPGGYRDICDESGLVHQADGNVVFYHHGRPAWASDTFNVTSQALSMQADGNLVLYRSAPTWSTATQNNPGAWLEVQDCNLMVRRPSDSQVIWESHTSCPPPPPPPPSPIADVPTLPSNTYLPVGRQLTAPGGVAWLAHQGDGNVVLYAPGDAGALALWATGAAGANTFFTMQLDGNAVLYGAAGAVWSSETYGHPGAEVVLQDDCNLVVYENGAPLWSNNTRCPPRLPARFALRVAGGQIIAAENGGGSVVIANRWAVGASGNLHQGPRRRRPHRAAHRHRRSLRASHQRRRCRQLRGLPRAGHFRRRVGVLHRRVRRQKPHRPQDLARLLRHRPRGRRSGLLVTNRLNRGAWETFEVIPLP